MTVSFSYRNQSIDLQSKSMDWFLYDRDLRCERVNSLQTVLPLYLIMSLLSPICKQPSGAIEIDILEILMKESPRRASATENIFPGSFVIYFETAISPNTSKGELPTTTENIKVAFQGLQKIA